MGLEIALTVVGALIAIVGMVSGIISLWLIAKYYKYNRRLNSIGMTGMEIARSILDRNGLEHIGVKRTGSIWFGNSYSHYFDMGIPEAAKGISALMSRQNFHLAFNDQPVIRRTAYCKFVREGMSFVRSDGGVSPCMALLHNGHTWLSNVRRTIYHHSFGNVKELPLSEIWNSADYRAFRRKFDNFDFSPCIYCGHCEMFEDNREDCIGNVHPTCGGCLWAEGVLSCP